MNIAEFREYVAGLDGEKKEKANLWCTGIGLQKVDGLSTSEFLLDVAKKNIMRMMTMNLHS